ncbi:MAG: hypothetical protein KJN98_07700, partial [Pontiella sp.]|nr:hypothetical protein [Pontiella sp.]
MIKTYISSLLVVALAGVQVARAQDSLDDVFAQLDAAQGSGQVAPAVSSTPAPASVQTAPQAEVATVEPVNMTEPAATDLYSQGVKLYNQGQYAKAEATFEAVLAASPYDLKAMEYLKRTARKIAAAQVQLQSASRAQALAEVDAAWNQDMQVDASVIDQGRTKEKSPEQLAIEAMTARLQGIMIPSLDFRDANINDVVMFLTETARRVDAQKKGVNIVLLGMNTSMAADQGSITISIRDMSLYEALQYIVEMASLKFDVQAKAVAVMPVNYVPVTELKLISFDVIPEIGMELESMSGGDGGGVGDLFGDSAVEEAAGPADVKNFFSIVDWPEGSSAIYQPNFHKLFVKNTSANIKAVEDILGDLEEEAIKKRSQQVEIEAKFVEFSEGALEELGFDWTAYGEEINGELSMRGSGFQKATGFDVGGITPSLNVNSSTIYTDPATGYQIVNDPTGQGRPGQNLFGSAQRSNLSALEDVQSGILSLMGGNPAAMFFGGDDFDLRITAMEQEGTADVLSAPKVTTKSGNEAVIRVVEEHRYPQDWDV